MMERKGKLLYHNKSYIGDIRATPGIRLFQWLSGLSLRCGSRFPSNPLIIRVTYFLMFRFNKETPNKKGKRVLLEYL